MGLAGDARAMPTASTCSRSAGARRRPARAPPRRAALVEGRPGFELIKGSQRGGGSTGSLRAERAPLTLHEAPRRSPVRQKAGVARDLVCDGHSPPSGHERSRFGGGGPTLSSVSLERGASRRDVSPMAGTCPRSDPSTACPARTPATSRRRRAPHASGPAPAPLRRARRRHHLVRGATRARRFAACGIPPCAKVVVAESGAARCADRATPGSPAAPEGRG